MLGILGQKLGMTRVIQDDGRVIPITVVKCEPNTIAQIKTSEVDGYPALVLGLSQLKNPTKTHKYKFLKEIKGEAEAKKGDSVTVEIFEEGEQVNITGTSKGKGFQGVIKRHNMARGPMSHGSHHKRQPGSVGACAAPGRITRGKKLPGRMGSNTVTIQKTSIAYIDKKNNLIGIKGAVPGGNKSLVTIKKCQK